MATSRFSLLLFLCVLFLLSACQSVTTDPVTSDFDYFPLETGQYIIYDVQEDVYPLNGTPVQRRFQLKEVTGSPYTDVSGQKAYRLVRYRRTQPGQLWQMDSIWSARLVTNEATRTENGLEFVSLLMPVSNGQRWDGNRYNGFGEDTYEVRNANQPFRVLDKQFTQTVTVVAQDDSTLISQEKRRTVYARPIGLIYKERISLQFCTDSPACIGKNQIDYGIRQVYRIQTYGKE